MSIMTIRELNANVSKALAKAEAGDDILLTRNGKPVLRITREGVDAAEARRSEAIERLDKLLKQGVPGLQAPLTYDERTTR